jgi:antitoxin MazE
MAQATLGKWGRNLAVRLPSEVVKAAGMHPGEKVEIEARGPDIVIRRCDAAAIADAQAAAEEIIRESKNYTLDAAEILEMLHEGRRG